MKNLLLILGLFSCGISSCMDTPKDALSFFSQVPSEIFTLVVPTIDDEYNTNTAEMTPLLVAQKYAPARKFAQTCHIANQKVSMAYPDLNRCRKYIFAHRSSKHSRIPASLFIANKDISNNTAVGATYDNKSLEFIRGSL